MLHVLKSKTLTEYEIIKLQIFRNNPKIPYENILLQIRKVLHYMHAVHCQCVAFLGGEVREVITVLSPLVHMENVCLFSTRNGIFLK